MQAADTVSWAINRVLDLIVPAIGIFALFFWAPLLATYNYVTHQLLRSKPTSFWDPLDKVVIITGASSGIGENIAYEYAKRGARLLLVARREAKLQAVARKCERLGAHEAEVLQADTGIEDDCGRIVETTINKFGQIDVLVLNAGIGQAHLFEHTDSVEAMQPTVAINFWGYVYPTLFALPYLKKARGTIIVNSSMAGFTPVARHSLYGASKAMLIQFFDTLRIEERGAIHITTVFPGAVASELTAGKVLKEHGELELDLDRRDETIGPQPMLGTETCAAAMVDAAHRRKRYLVVPFWVNVFWLFRVLAPEFLSFLFYQGQVATLPGKPAPTKMTMDAIKGRQWLYHPPTRSEEEAVTALMSTAK